MTNSFQIRHCLFCLKIGSRDDSDVYIRMKLKAANQIGITTQHIKLPRSTRQEQIVDQIKQLNNNKGGHCYHMCSFFCHVITFEIFLQSLWNDSLWNFSHTIVVYHIILKFWKVALQKAIRNEKFLQWKHFIYKFSSPNQFAKITCKLSYLSSWKLKIHITIILNSFKIA